MAQEVMETILKRVFSVSSLKTGKTEFVFFHLEATKQQSGMKP